MRATAIGSMMMKWRITKSCRPLRGLDVRLRNIPGVPPSAPPQAIFCRPHPRAKTYVLRVKMWVKTRIVSSPHSRFPTPRSLFFLFDISCSIVQERRQGSNFAADLLAASREAPAVGVALNDAPDARGADVDVKDFAEVRGLEYAVFAPVFGEDGFHPLQRERMHAAVETVDRLDRRLLTIIDVAEAVVIDWRQAEDQTQSALVTGGDLSVADESRDGEGSGFHRIDRVFADRISGKAAIGDRDQTPRVAVNRPRRRLQSPDEEFVE